MGRGRGERTQDAGLGERTGRLWDLDKCHFQDNEEMTLW